MTTTIRSELHAVVDEKPRQRVAPDHQRPAPTICCRLYMLKNIDNQATDGEEKSKPEVIKLGLDKPA